jgi:hypothetical protein
MGKFDFILSSLKEIISDGKGGNLSDVISKVLKSLEKSFERVDFEKIGEYLEETLNFLREEGTEYYEYFKMAWNYEEKSCNEYSFAEAVSWFKNNSPKGMTGIKASLRKKKNDNGIIAVHHFFVSNDNEPLLNGAYPYRVVNTLTLDTDLLNQFDNKNLLIIK